jgi:hypothetical protein
VHIQPLQAVQGRVLMLNFVKVDEHCFDAKFCCHCRLCKEELQRQGGNINVDKWLANGFAKWFQAHVRSLALVQLPLDFLYVLFTLGYLCRLEICKISVLICMLWRANRRRE